MVELGVFRISVGLAAEQPNRGRVVAKICQEAQEQAPAAYRNHERATSGQSQQDLGGDGLISVGPERVEVRVYEIAAALPCYVHRRAQKLAAPAVDLNQLHAQLPQLLILGAGDGCWDHAGHAES